MHIGPFRTGAVAIFSGVLFVGLSSAADLSSADKSFLKDSAESGNAEIELANLALKKTSRPDIKAFAHRIVTDHQKAKEQLKSLAAANHIDLPDGIGVKYTAKKARLELLQGRDFDDDYINSMVDDHKADIAAFQKESENGSDADVKKFASMAIPILKQHLSMARTLQGKMVTPK